MKYFIGQWYWIDNGCHLLHGIKNAEIQKLLLFL